MHSGYFPQQCAPEIEQALVAGLWHQPERLAETCRWLDPNAHLSLPYLRLVLYAIKRCYSELGAADFPLVVQCLRELGSLTEVGGVEALDSLYETRWYPPLFPIYALFLRERALARCSDPKAPPPFFSGGSGSLELSKVRKSAQHPVYTGSARIGGHFYTIRGWPKGEEAGVELKFFRQ
jgi:hypothetical protein